ncbi:MAG: 50S ribosomal protein L23 [Deltaproteobacteria bacterium]|nr:MAG: 50S ribosomal protein L23 [Deltaproteobacteria bacterium]
MANTVYQILKRPVVTEKTNDLREDANQFVFEVAKDANKVAIRRAVESVFGVRVVDVRTCVVRGKVKRVRRFLGKRPNWKKAVVTLHDDDTIELFEGV